MNDGALYETFSVSVVVPAFNVQEYIVEAIDSLLTQRPSPREVIVVNDGSTDRTLEVVESFYCNDARVKVVSQSNQGAGAARNNGISLCTGDYVFCCDPDDAAMPNFFAELSERVAENPGLDIFCFNSIRFSEDGVAIPKVTHQQSGWRPGAIVLCEMVRRGDYTSAAWTFVLARRLIVDHELGFVGRTHEDHIFTAKGYLHSKLAFVSKEVYYRQRVRNGSLTESRKDEAYIHARFDAIHKVVALLESFLPPQFLTAVRKKYVRNSLLSVAHICAERYVSIPSRISVRFSEFSNYPCQSIKDFLIFRHPRLLVFLKRYDRYGTASRNTASQRLKSHRGLR